MKQLRILLVEDDSIVRMDIKEMLEEENMVVVGECGDGESALNMARMLKPDLVIMDVKMPVMDGITAATIMGEENIAPVLMLTAYSSTEFVQKAENAGVLAYLVKPVTKNSLLPACQIAYGRYEQFNYLKDENKNLQDSLETRKLIERAKGLLQKRYLLSEEKAFKKIRQISMDKNKSMREVAEAIILSLSGKKD